MRYFSSSVIVPRKEEAIGLLGNVGDEDFWP